ncbi:hypothetical protein TSAR_010591 [Trichomalopsis sarcophagae]|uniref:Uncharacterized protein n=1 Tax=Trichomalopsis sarcophagae TaxID=543379 RepID=A0A232FFY9_9HYME|nr:hypothetical protein TSAR_010591 [Trichomalopsis sarcophagae]
MEIVAVKSRTTLLTVGALLASACRARAVHAGAWTHSVCDATKGRCALNDVSWLLGWITYARRASLVFIVLSGIVLYYVPETRAPARKGCHYVIDLIASGLKAIVGGVDDSEEIKKTKGDDDSEMSKSFMIENATFLPLNFEESDKEYDNLEKNLRPNVSFSIPEAEILRSQECRKQPLLECQYLHESRRNRQPHLKIHHPRTMKFKEKSSVEKVSVCPMPLMQFDTFERQNFNTSFPLSNDNCNRRLDIKERSIDYVADYPFFEYSENKKHAKPVLDAHENILNKGRYGKPPSDISEIELSEWTESDFDEIVKRPQNDNYAQSISGCSKCNDGHVDHKIHEPHTEHSISPTRMNTKKSILKTGSSCHEKEKFKKIVKNPSKEHSDQSCYKEKTFQTDTELNQSSISRAFQWIFGGCPNKRKSISSYNK